VEFNTVVGLRLKLVRIEILNDSSLPSCTDGLLSSWSTSIDLNMDDVVTLRSQFSVIVDPAVENNVTRLHFFFLKSDWKGIKLISLVPTVKIETKIFSHIVGNLSQESTTVEEHWCIIQRFTRIEISLSIGYTKILFGSLKELFSESLFDSRISPVNLSLFCDKLPILNLLNFLLFEPFKVSSQVLSG
jgi:hypothetical protein